MPSRPPRPAHAQLTALLAATLATSMSNLAQTTVLGLLVYQLTRSELDLGFLGLAEFAPAALLVVVAGSVVDRFDRRRVAALAAMSSTIVALVLAWYVHHRDGFATTPIFLLVLAFGAGQAFLSPALSSILPAMVSGEGVPWLVARRFVVSEVAAILGPVLAGVLYGVGAWVPLVMVAALAALGAAAVLAIRVPAEGPLPGYELSPVGQVGHVLEEGIPASRGGLHEALDGLRFVRRQSILLGAISLDLFAVLFGGAVTLLPAIAVRLHAGAVGFGWLRASVGLGAGAMSVLISVRPIERRVGRMLLAAVAVFGAWTIVLGVTHSYTLAFIAIFALSAADAVSVFIRATLVPLATPAEMRGRVLAVENVFIGASNELGGFESGAVGQLLGTTGSVVVGGIATLVVAIAWAVLFAPLRRIDRFPTPLPAAGGGKEGHRC
ncbi:MAG TPA: MFS transporter [Acidimicrobiales bacterium]|nr:MFS transporter [Acidimicrobiales bacterium]